ncbi:MAG: hypothetical protein ACYTHJ_04905 [Planctomycetota bacterium]|jgi:hypothetical protein
MQGSHTESRDAGAKGGSNRRRNYLINPLFQLKYTLTLAIGAFVVACFMGISMYGFMFQQARQKAMNPMGASVWDNSVVIFLFALTFAAMLLVVLGCWGITITHRISGPLYVFMRNLKELEQGRFPAFRALRKRDEFKELHEQLFKTSESIKRQKQEQLDHVSELWSRLQQVQHLDATAREAALSSMASDMSSLRDELASALDKKTEFASGASGSKSDEATTVDGA